ncbi:hypothetical protein PROFUN_11754 [Planoprotostelium fungivorum]|uniref:SET domain-containing protein n=1 Tax=Planoprotostelium fungivorum TaxID=1890364 RepID=A0A2P6MYG3_9EUKA|nr:hypothetical protein PROFUN_11754 [Planoprotostelium fungivorum]
MTDGIMHGDEHVTTGQERSDKRELFVPGTSVHVLSTEGKIRTQYGPSLGVKWAENVAKKIVNSIKPLGKRQAEIDIGKNAWAMRYYDTHRQYLPAMSRADFSFPNDQDPWDEEKEFHAFSRLSPKKQIRDMFTHFLKEYPTGRSPYPPQLREDRVAQFKHLSKTASAAVTDKMKSEVYQEGSIITHPAGFTLQIRKSRVDHPESGYGVFLQGRAIPGTVICIYPGTLYWPGELNDEVAKDNEYLIMRTDNIVIDGKDYGKVAHEAHRLSALNALAGFGDDEDFVGLEQYRNPFAIGNYINHPPANILPNIQQMTYNFATKREDNALTPKERKFVPNPKSIQKTAVVRELMSFGDGEPTLLCVANRHIYNEELFMNYRYNPSHSAPDWYSHVDLGEDSDRWRAKEQTRREVEREQKKQRKEQKEKEEAKEGEQ